MYASRLSIQVCKTGRLSLAKNVLARTSCRQLSSAIARPYLPRSTQVGLPLVRRVKSITAKQFYSDESYTIPNGKLMLGCIPLYYYIFCLCFLICCAHRANSSDLKFTRDHEWVRVEADDIATVGISSYASLALGDVVYVELPSVGQIFEQEEVIGAVESVKSASDIYAPLNGEVVETNLLLESKPGLINLEPYEKGWICKIKLSDSSDLGDLLDAKSYSTFLATGSSDTDS